MRTLTLAGLLMCVALPAAAQRPTRDTRAQIQGLHYPPLRFTPPVPKRVTLSNGVPVYLLEDHSLPLLDVEVVSKVGVANLPDSLWGVGWQADVLMRTGGTTRLSPDSVDQLVEFYALNVFISTGNEQSTASFSGLSRYRDQMLDLGFDLLRNPRNDTSRVRITAGQQLEAWRRRNDQPGSVLNRAWPQVLLGDHPLGRTQVTPDEVAGFTPARFRWTQERIFCPQNLLIGVSGDFDEKTLLAKLESLFRGWTRCAPGLRAIPPLQFATGPKIVLVEKDVNQTNIWMGHAGSIRVADTPDYYAAQVADFLLGGGGGFNSRLLQRLRSDSGFAYSTFSNWDADTRREGIFFAGAQIRAEKTVAGLSLMRQIIGSMATDPVTARDVQLAKDNEVNSFVFRFQNAGQIVAQQLGYAVDGLPGNWFDLYLKGIQAVTPEQVADVSRRLLHPDRLVMVVVGKPSAFDKPLTTLGPVTMMPVDSIHR
ncbi:MAG TPA: pitrilysin family protein [Gemmatimonadales bacterium]|nr:pitrilysin family protein [Gemmatimonadales bacterium]